MPHGSRSVRTVNGRSASPGRPVPGTTPVAAVASSLASTAGRRARAEVAELGGQFGFEGVLEGDDRRPTGTVGPGFAAAVPVAAAVAVPATVAIAIAATTTTTTAAAAGFDLGGVGQ